MKRRTTASPLAAMPVADVGRAARVLGRRQRAPHDDLVGRVGERELEVRIRERVARAVADRRVEDQQALVRRIGLQVRRVDRQRADVAQRPDRAAGRRAHADQQRPRLRPVGGERVAEMEQRLADQQHEQHGNAGDVEPAQRTRPRARPVPREAAVVVDARGRVVVVRLERGRAGRAPPRRGRAAASASSCAGRSACALRSVTVGGPATSSSCGSGSPSARTGGASEISCALPSNTWRQCPQRT